MANYHNNIAIFALENQLQLLITPLFMKRLLLLVAVVGLCGSVAAQNDAPETEIVQRPSRTAYANQAGIKFEVMGSLANHGGPEMVFLAAEYSHYWWNNWGIRAGLKYGVNHDEVYSMPLHVSWRATPRTSRRGRDARAYYVFPYERPRPDGDTHRYYYDEYYPLREKGVGGVLSDMALGAVTASSPVVFDLHAGFTPTLLGQGTYQHDGYWMGTYEVRRRFMCSFDVGGRAMFQVWRFGLLFDVTYQLMLTDNFRYEGTKCSRHYINVGAGIVYRF